MPIYTTKSIKERHRWIAILDKLAAVNLLGHKVSCSTATLSTIGNGYGGCMTLFGKHPSILEDEPVFEILSYSHPESDIETTFIAKHYSNLVVAVDSMYGIMESFQFNGTTYDITQLDDLNIRKISEQVINGIAMSLGHIIYESGNDATPDQTSVSARYVIGDAVSMSQGLRSEALLFNRVCRSLDIMHQKERSEQLDRENRTIIAQRNDSDIDRRVFDRRFGLTVQ